MARHVDITALLIEKKVGRSAGNYGLAPKCWLRQLEEIRNLPEAPTATV